MVVHGDSVYTATEVRMLEVLEAFGLIAKGIERCNETGQAPIMRHGKPIVWGNGHTMTSRVYCHREKGHRDKHLASWNGIEVAWSDEELDEEVRPSCQRCGGRGVTLPAGYFSGPSGRHDPQQEIPCPVCEDDYR
jgi:hypothetical protein